MIEQSEFSASESYHKITRLELYVILGIITFSSISTLLFLDYTDNQVKINIVEMAKLSPKMWYLLKYGFLALIMTGIMLTVLPMPRPGDGLDLIDMLGDDFSEPYIPPSVESYHILRQDLKICFTNVSRDLWDQSPTFENNRSESETPSIQNEQTSSMFTLLSSFNNVLSAVGIKGAIIEPCILHCMMHTHYRELLSKRNFNITKVPLTKNVVTYAIMGQDAVVLQQKDILANFSDAGFVPHFVTTPAPVWMKINATTIVSHILYKRELHTIHAVVFYERGTYLWHDGLPSTDDPVIPGLHFTEHSGAYEKFTFFPLGSDESPLPSFYIPSTSHYFLLETLSSRFLECNASRHQDDLYSEHPKSHLGMSGKRFNVRAVTALRQLKSIFHPLLMNFWIWSGTMLGWYRDCGVIPYTSDVDFGAWASEVKDLSWIVHQLLNNKHVQIRELMGMQEEALEFNIHCYGMRNDVFFLYKIKNGSWCSGHSPKQGYYFRYYYPHFTLCSAELLGEKVQVPCETERVIETEYGSEWRTPVTSWHYESSIHNRGPNIYWGSDQIRKTYIYY